jgi:cytochrome P450
MEPRRDAADVEGFLGTRDRDPHPFYEELRRTGVVWDKGARAWLVATHAGCQAVFEQDIEVFEHADAARTDDVLVRIAGGPRALKFLDGEDQRRVHAWWLRALSPKAVLLLQQELLGAVVDEAVDRFVHRGEAELSRDLATRVPIRAIAAVLDIPWRDEAWIDRCDALLNVLAEFFDQRLCGSAELDNRAIAATDEWMDLIRPIVHDRRSGTGGDLISKLWRDGPQLLDGWNEADVLSALRTMFLGGKDTTALGILNALHRVLLDDVLRDELIAGGRWAVTAFVEESLRLDAPIQFRARVAKRPVRIADADIAAGHTVVPILAGAGRDPARWPRPDDVMLDRPLARTHLAFAHGPRTCVGAALARAEIHQVVTTMLRRFPSARLTGDAVYSGFTMRAFRPLHVRFEPASAS